MAYTIVDIYMMMMIAMKIDDIFIDGNDDDKLSFLLYDHNGIRINVLFNNFTRVYIFSVRVLYGFMTENYFYDYDYSYLTTNRDTQKYILYVCACAYVNVLCIRHYSLVSANIKYAFILDT